MLVLLMLVLWLVLLVMVLVLVHDINIEIVELLWGRAVGIGV